MKLHIGYYNNSEVVLVHALDAITVASFPALFTVKFLIACSLQKQAWEIFSLVPRPLPDCISQPWRKIGRRPGSKTSSRPEMVDSVS